MQALGWTLANLLYYAESTEYAARALLAHRAHKLAHPAPNADNRWIAPLLMQEIDSHTEITASSGSDGGSVGMLGTAGMSGTAGTVGAGGTATTLHYVGGYVKEWQHLPARDLGIILEGVCNLVSFARHNRMVSIFDFPSFPRHFRHLFLLASSYPLKSLYGSLLTEDLQRFKHYYLEAHSSFLYIID